MDEIEAIKQIIEQLRAKLHGQAQGKCFTDPEVVKVSQELNEMLNKYERLLSEKCNREP